MITNNLDHCIANPLTQDTDFLLKNCSADCLNDCQKMDHFSIFLMYRGQLHVSYNRQIFELKEQGIFFAQPTRFIKIEASPQAVCLQMSFSKDFFCLEKHQEQIGCKGILFEDKSDKPYLHLSTHQLTELEAIIVKIAQEFEINTHLDKDMIVTYLKLYLKMAIRIKQEQGQVDGIVTQGNPVVEHLQTLIEMNYRQHKSPAYYAKCLCHSNKNLARIVKSQLNINLTDMITGRIIEEAKKELYHNEKSIKQIAHELGYYDPYYFSRLFKKSVKVSPERFRVSIER
jgi:AraC family transcriptional regulator, transcriptional activator of pobA